MFGHNSGAARRRRSLTLAPALILIAGLTLLAGLQPCASRAAGAASKGLVANIAVAYDIRPQDSAVDISWRVSLQNTGPSPFAEATDGGFAPSLDSTFIFVMGNGAGLRVTGANGQPLPVTLRVAEDGSAGAALVDFGHALKLSETFSFTLEYMVPQGDNDFYVVSPGYIYLPPYFGVPADTYLSNTLTVTAPESRAGQVFIDQDQASCRALQGNGRAGYECQIGPAGAGVDVEMVDPAARKVTSQDVTIDGQQKELILRYLDREQAWADHVSAFAVQAIPVLEEIIGAPYPGPKALRISRKGSQEIYGAAGVAACDSGMCGIAVSRGSDDQVLLHELTHVWTQSFKNRWLAEGTAEFISRKAAQRMGLTSSDPVRSQGNEQPTFALDEWGDFVDFLKAPAEVLEREYEGYDRARRFLELAEERVGPEAMRSTYAALVPMETRQVNSRQFMDSLENARGKNLDDLFSGWIFPQSFSPTLVERRQARDRFTALKARVDAEAPELPKDALDAIHKNIDDWKFADAIDGVEKAEPGLDSYLKIRDRALALRAATEKAIVAYPIPYVRAEQSLDFTAVVGSIDQAEEALRVYAAAKEKVSAPGSLWEKIGLFGKDPDGQLRDAAGQFAWANFDATVEKSHAAEAIVENATADSLTHLLVGLGVLIGFVAVAFFGLRWALRSEPSPAGSES